MIIVIAIAEGSGFMGHLLIFAVEYVEFTKKASVEKRRNKGQHLKK